MPPLCPQLSRLVALLFRSATQDELAEELDIFGGPPDKVRTLSVPRPPPLRMLLAVDRGPPPSILPPHSLLTLRPAEALFSVRRRVVLCAGTLEIVV